MPATEMVHVRIDKRIKTKAAKTLASMGLSVSDAVRVLLTRVAAEKALPFDVKVPNATNDCGHPGGSHWQAAIVPQSLRPDGRPECGRLSVPARFKRDFKREKSRTTQTRP